MVQRFMVQRFMVQRFMVQRFMVQRFMVQEKNEHRTLNFEWEKMKKQNIGSEVQSSRKK
jgi:hypothetical protein